MKLEVGKRYVMRNGEITGPLERCMHMPEWLKDLRHTWKENGMWSASDVTGAYDIVAEYVEPQPQQPLRWVENCKPDKPGIWAQLYNSGNIGVQLWFPCDINGVEHAAKATRCYLGPIPEILPPKKKVTQRLWLLVGRQVDDKTAMYLQQWMDGDSKPYGDADWIRTDRTREREI